MNYAEHVDETQSDNGSLTHRQQLAIVQILALSGNTDRRFASSFEGMWAAVFAF